jgi:hypothetical protein
MHNDFMAIGMMNGWLGYDDLDSWLIALGF